MMMRPPLFMCFSAACVATSAPRTLMSITRSISSSVVSSKVFGIAVPALFTSTSSRPKVATVFSTAPLTASTSAASAWIATAFPPLSSIALTTAEAALASFAYVMDTLAPSAASRFAIAAPMPREPPVTSATFLLNLDIRSEEHTSELQSRLHLVCRLLLEKKKTPPNTCASAVSRRQEDDRTTRRHYLHVYEHSEAQVAAQRSLHPMHAVQSHMRHPPERTC